MPTLTTIIGAVGIATSAAGMGLQYKGAQQQQKAQKVSQAAQMQAEDLKRRQMELDAMRRKREAIRQGQLAQSQALAVATAQGATGDGSSALMGIEGTLSGQVGRNLKAIEENREIGSSLFDANAQNSAGNAMAAKAAGTVNMGAGLTSLGGSIVNNSKTIAKIGSVAVGKDLS